MKALKSTLGHVDDADRAEGVDAVVVAGVALVGDQQAARERRERHHVGCGADRDVVDVVAVEVEEDHGARVGGRIGLDGYRDHAVAYGHAVGAGAVGGDVDLVHQRRGRRVADVEDIDGDLEVVDDEQLLRAGIVGRDLRRSLVERGLAIGLRVGTQHLDRHPARRERNDQHPPRR